MELKPVSDRELWVACAPGCDWQLPVFCDPYSHEGPLATHYAVRPAMSLLAAPHAVLESHLRKHDLAGAKSHWVVEGDVLGKLARKAPGITPAYYYRWEDREPRVIIDESEEVKQETLPAWGFLQHVAKQSALDFAVVKLVWLEIQRLAPDWLLNRQQPLRFSFMTIYPVPFRVNWKEIMLARHPKCAPMFRKGEGERDAYLQRVGFIEELGSADLTAVDGKSKFFHWTMECVPTPYWEQCVREAEGTRLGVRGPARYVDYYEGRIKNHLKSILTAFSAWLRQMAVPVGRVGESAVSGRPVLLPTKKFGVLPQRHDSDIAPIMVCGDEVALKPGKHVGLDQAAARLLSVPAVLEGAEDVRGCEEVGNPGGELDQPADAGGGAGGVRLLDADQGETEVL